MRIDNLSELPDYVKDVVRGKRSTGYYLPNSPFFNRLLETVHTIEYEVEHYDPFFRDSSLLECQNDALGSMVNSDRLLINLSPGLGKTYVAIHYLRYANTANVMIIAPKSLHYVWTTHLDQLTDLPYTVRPKTHAHDRVTITNIQQVSKIEYVDRPDVIIVDESILLKNRKSKNYKDFKTFLSTCKKIYFLSGSPYSKNISDLWAQLNLLYPDIFTSFWDFTKVFCRVEIDRYGWKIKENRPDIENVLKYVLQDYMFSAHIDDHITLPEQKTYILDIKPSPTQLRIAKELRKKGKFEDVLIDGPLSLLTRLKQLSLSLSLLGLTGSTEKETALNELLEYVEYPAIVASTSNVFLEQQHKQRKGSTLFNADSPDGHVSFVNGSSDLMFLQVASGKFGHSFTMAKTLIICDYTFNSDDLYQLLARVKRMNSKHTVTIYHLHSLEIDSIMYELAIERNLSVETVLRKLGE